MSGIASPALAQNPTSTPSQPSDAQQPAEQSDQTLKVNVNVVGLFFNVKDKHGALIPNLTKDDFEVFEDGKPQTIKYFAAESNLPLTLGILIDSSGSQLQSARHGERSRRRVPAPDSHRQGRGLRHRLQHRVPNWCRTSPATFTACRPR